jgi:hypothetical protein
MRTMDGVARLEDEPLVRDQAEAGHEASTHKGAATRCETATRGETATRNETATRDHDEWWDARFRPDDVMDRLLHPRAAVAPLDWWAATGWDVFDRFLHPLPDEMS